MNKRSAQKKNTEKKSVILLSNDRISCEQFFRKIENDYVERILSVQEAFDSKGGNKCIIIGKVVGVQPTISNNIRRDIIEKSDPATFIVIKEVIASSENVTYGNLYKVKFLGAIANEFLEADIKVGDRIAIRKLATIVENTEYKPSTYLSLLTPLVLDGCDTTVIIGKKVTGEKRCETPDSDDQHISYPSQRNDRTEIGETSSPIVLVQKLQSSNSFGLSSKNKRTFNNGFQNSSLLSSSSNCHDITSMKNKKSRIDPPQKHPLHVALKEDSQFEDDDISIHAKYCEKNKYTNLKDINQTHVNSRIDVFGIVIDVLQSQENGRNKKMLRFKIIDSSIPLHKSFEILLFYTNEKPKICKRWIVRVKHVKIESINGELNGRIFTPGCLICFPTEKGMPKFITSRKKPYDISDEDRLILKNLKTYLATQKSWNVLTLPNSYYPDAPNGKGLTHVKLEDITENTTFFSLKCKIVNVRFFLAMKMAFLTVDDNTVCHPPTYQFPKTGSDLSWPSIVQAEEVYCANSSKIDILIKNMDSNFNSLELFAEGRFVDIAEIQTRKILTDNEHGLMFIADMKTAKISEIDKISQVDQIDRVSSSDQIEPASSSVQIEKEVSSENEESSPERNTMEISEYNELLAECRVEGMSPTTEKLLAPIPEVQGRRKKRTEIKKRKRRKLIPTNTSGCNLLTEDFLSDSIEDLNVSIHENDQNTLMEHACNEQLNRIEDRLSKMEGSEVSKKSDTSNPQSIQKIFRTKSSCSRETQIVSIDDARLPLLRIQKLTEDEIIELSSDATVRSEFSKKGDRQSPDLLQRIAKLIGEKTPDAAKLIKSIDGEIDRSIANTDSSFDVESKARNVDNLSDSSSTSKHGKSSFREEDQLTLNNETITSDKFSSSNNEILSTVEKMDCTIHDNVPVEECSISESGVVPDRGHSSNINKIRLSNDSKDIVNQSKSKSRFNFQRTILKDDDESILENTKRKQSERNQQNRKKKNTQSAKKLTPSSSKPLEKDKDVSDHSYDFVGRILESNELGEFEEDIIYNTPEKTVVENVCSERPKNSSNSIRKHRTCDEENRLCDEKSRVSSSPTQFSPTVSNNLQIPNTDNHKTGAKRNCPSPFTSMVTERFCPPKEQAICTRKSPHKRKSEQSLFSLQHSPPQSIVTEKYNFTGERVMCTRKSIPHKKAFLPQDIEDKNKSSTIEKWLQQVDPNVDTGEFADDQIMMEPNTGPLLDESQNLPESHNLAEYITTREDINTPRPGRLISDNAVLINSEPYILDEPLDIISGYCKESCDEFFRYSVLKFDSDSNPICPGCESEGRTIEVQLVFLFKLNLTLIKSPNVCYTVLVHANQASKFLGCTEHQYINDETLRSRIVKKLSEHLLLKGKTSSAVYSPSLPVNLKVTSNSEIASVTVHLIDTVLPEPNPDSQPPIESFL